MNIEQQCELVLKTARQEDAECKNRIKAIKKQLEQLSSELKTIGISNKWDELASLRNTINKRERELRKRALNYELDPLKVLEARQDITMWITKGESSNRMIQMDINNKKTIRLKAWLSIDQNNLNTHQQYDRQPIEKALIDSLFTEENECLNNQLEKVENAMKTLSQLSKGIDNLKSTIKSSGLA